MTAVTVSTLVPDNVSPSCSCFYPVVLASCFYEFAVNIGVLFSARFCFESLQFILVYIQCHTTSTCYLFFTYELYMRFYSLHRPTGYITWIYTCDCTGHTTWFYLLVYIPPPLCDFVPYTRPLRVILFSTNDPSTSLHVKLYIGTKSCRLV